jgi:hypothetical protein
MRVSGYLDDNRLNSKVAALFPTFGMVDEFSLGYQAVASQVDRDIGLVLDRSGSMNERDPYDWPHRFTPFSRTVYDAAVRAGVMYRRRGEYYYSSGYDETSYQDWVYESYLGLGEPPQSLWTQLLEAVDVFLDVLETTDQNEQVSLGTYASTGRLDLELITDYDLIRNRLARINPDGNTAIGHGMQQTIPSLLSTYARPFAAKTLVVMTDGIHNTGADPVTVARNIVASHDVTIHTVTFGDGADQSRMQRVAEIGGGEHYHADDGDELQAIFEEIANNLPTIITQ